MKQNNLSENLYTLRKGRGLSQEAFAEHIHISRQAVSKWERGEAYPDTENLIEIAAFYGITLDELVHAPNAAACAPTSGEMCAELTDSSCREEDEASHKTYEPDAIEDALEADDAARAERGITVKGQLHLDWDALPYPIIVTVVYLLLGFLTLRGWEVGWTLYVTVPVYYSIVDCLRTHRLSPFAYPVFVTFVYLFVGMLFYIWHPTWLLFLTVPIYYGVADMIDRRRR